MHDELGIICASLNQIGNTRTAQPEWTYQSASSSDDISIRMGTLPREFVCTENLTPWTKLLPARNQVPLSHYINGYQ
jgi:phosphatidylinositol glycan class T